MKALNWAWQHFHFPKNCFNVVISALQGFATACLLTKVSVLQLWTKSLGFISYSHVLLHGRIHDIEHPDDPIDHGEGEGNNGTDIVSHYSCSSQPSLGFFALLLGFTGNKIFINYALIETELTFIESSKFASYE